MRCGRCGNENDPANRFCGMCGASLVATTATAGRPASQAATVPTGSVAAPSQPQVPLPESSGLGSSSNAERRPSPLASSPARTSEVRTTGIPASAVRSGEVQRSEVRPSEARPGAGPVITGHSFLGLSTPGPAVDRNAEPDALRPSLNVDYLLDDEEEPKRGWGKLVLIVVALALAVGLGYLHFKQAGFDGLIAGDKKPEATKPTSDAPQSPDSGTPAGPTTSNAATPAAEAANNGTAPATSGGAATPAQPSSQLPPQSAPSQTAPATSQPTPASQTAPAPAQAAPASWQPGPATSAPTQAAPSQAQTSDPNLPVGAAPPTPTSEQQAAAPERRPAPKAAVPAPVMAKPPAAKPIDPVTNAERYIYGRGAREDCDHGLRLLKQAAEESNAKAMISMGALYSTGTCTPRDLPTAYRWFAMALHKEPDNQPLQDDLQRLWSQMTQPERQLAIKLSQ